MKKSKLLLIVITFMLVTSLFFVGCTKKSSTKLYTGLKISSHSNTKLIAASWIYLGGTFQYTSGPNLGQNIKFPYKNVNILYIAFAGVVNNDQFGFYNSSYMSHFKTIIANARSQNSNIKIIISQNWGNPYSSTLSALSSNQINTFATSVANFIKNNHLNGYDVDYEDNNVISNFPAFSTAIRTALNKINPNYLFTISPDQTTYLTKKSLKNINMINMQSYAGTYSNQFTNPKGLDVPSYKLFYGANIENQGSNSKSNARSQIQSGLSAANANHLGGVFTWRLNSNDYTIEDYAQTYLWNQING